MPQLQVLEFRCIPPRIEPVRIPDQASILERQVDRHRVVLHRISGVPALGLPIITSPVGRSETSRPFRRLCAEIYFREYP